MIQLFFKELPTVFAPNVILPKQIFANRRRILK